MGSLQEPFITSEQSLQPHLIHFLSSIILTLKPLKHLSLRLGVRSDFSVRPHPKFMPWMRTPLWCWVLTCLFHGGVTFLLRGGQSGICPQCPSCKHGLVWKVSALLALSTSLLPFCHRSHSQRSPLDASAFLSGFQNCKEWIAVLYKSSLGVLAWHLRTD